MTLNDLKSEFSHAYPQAAHVAENSFATKLPRAPKGPSQLDAEVAVRHYRLDKLSEGSIVLRVAEPGVVQDAKEVGTNKANDDEAQPSEIRGGKSEAVSG